MGRKKLWAEEMQSRFQAGIFARIERVLNKDEDRTEFVRQAVERELKRRERQNGRVRLVSDWSQKPRHRA